MWISNGLSEIKKQVLTAVNCFKLTQCFYYSTAWSLLIGSAIYTGAVQQGYAGTGNTPGSAEYLSGFILSWTAVCTGLIGSTLFWMNLKKLKGEE